MAVPIPGPPSEVRPARPARPARQDRPDRRAKPGSHLDLTDQNGAAAVISGSAVLLV
jgi:hypothetical protein